jgi:uncharacterized protein (DUF1778 family)
LFYFLVDGGQIAMSAQSTQISAHISEETKKLLDAFVRSHGVKKAFLVESALLHHLQALRELPADVVIPPRLVVSKESGKVITEILATPAPPTPTMKALMSGNDIGDPPVE